MDHESALSLVHRAITEHEYLEPSEYTLETTLRDLGSDSLDVVEMIMIIECDIQVATGKPFDFDDNVAGKLNSKSTVGDLVKLVEQDGPTVSIGTST